jgi:hypothetical protein
MYCSPSSTETFQGVGLKSYKIFDDLSNLASMESNFKALRDAMDAADSPAIPYLGSIAHMKMN